MTDNNNLAKGDAWDVVLSPLPFSPGKVMKRRMKDIHVRKKAIKIYMIKIYSNMLNTWFHDLYDNLPNHEPRYWHIFIGTNNKYAVALPLKVLSHNSYKFNALFKKSTTFCICFQLELHFLLAHKKLLTFSIRSQLLLLFLRYIKK